MSNLINNILPNENVATPSATTSSEQTVKDKPSLFDSLLTNTGTPEETKVTSDIKQEIKEVKTEEIVALNSEEIKVDDSEIKKEQLDLTKKVEEVDSQGQKLAGTGSLLDRLILEAKTNAKEIVNTDNQKINDLNNKIDNSNILKQEIKPEEILAVSAEEVKLEDSEIKKEQLVVTKKVEEVDTKEQKNTEVNSLLDRLILEAKTDTKELVNKEVVTTNLSDTSEQTIENKPSLFDSLLKNNVVTEEIKVTTDVKQEPKEVKTEEIKTEKATNNLTEKIDIESKNSVVEVVLNNEVVNKKLEIKKIDEIVNSNNIVDVIEDISLVENLSTGTDKVIVVDNIVKKELMDSPVDSNIQLVEEPENINLKINNESILPSEVIEKTDINVLEKTDAKKDVKISLMDQLIQKNSEKLVADSTNEIGENINTSSKDGLSKDLISNIYLGSQKNKINNQTLFNKNEAISLLKDGNSIQAVKASAEILDLGLQSVSIEKDIDLENIDVKKSNIDLLNKKNLIDNLLLKNDIRGEEVKDLITKSVDASAALLENTLNVSEDAVVNVNSPLSYNIQSKIIGAKQQMATMMSDIARQMYENYKPPVTVFRINLNPVDLGNIAILMKNDKNNGLSISMNISNPTTLDALMDNQNVLRNSLNKTFDENTKFNLDFSSSNQNDNQSSNNQSNQEQNRRFERQMDTQSVLQLKEENKNREENIDYM
jgi:hypothetical protein